MQIIGFNGPPRSGKTTLRDKLVDQLVRLNIPHMLVGYADVLYKPAMLLHGFRPYSSYEWEGDRERFKDHVFTNSSGGKWTGRDVIIELSENMQARDPNYLIHSVDSALASGRSNGCRIAIVENIGKAIEWDHLTKWPSTQPESAGIPKPMLFGFRERRESKDNIRKGRIYDHGMNFPGDNRISLAFDYRIINPDAEQVLGLAGIEV